MSEKKGIDVSYAQGKIDFDIITKKQVQFAIVRSSYGWQAGQKDQEFDRNIKGFRSKNIPCGAYHYSYAQSKEDAVKEAEYCIECIKGAKLELPVFLDLENSSVAQCGKRVCTDIAKAFCEHMKAKGYKTGIYINPNWLNNYVYKDELLGKYEIWLAQWGAEKPSYSCMVWQYKVGASGSIDGIGGEIDLDIMYSDTDEEKKDDKKTETKFKKGDEVEVIKPIDYDSGEKITIYPDKKYTVIEAVGDRVVIGINGKVTSAINAKYLKKVNGKKKTVTYTVKNGDTLTSIAKKYKTTVDKIVKENDLKNPDLIHAGEKLKITI